MNIMGVYHIKEEVVFKIYEEKIRKNNGLSYSVFRDLVRDLALQFKAQNGRFWL